MPAGPAGLSVSERDPLIELQIAYYRARAPQYDDDFAEGGPLPGEWELVRDALRSFNPTGSVLEIACGTGNWTTELVRTADRVVALDAAPEMIEIARAKTESDRVTFVAADIFAWEPAETFDCVVFGFWLSHVPPDRFEAFWELVRRCLAPEGRVFFIDEGRHEYWDEEFVGEAAVRRTLSDGSEHRAVKVFWEPKELEAKLEAMGWEAEVHPTGALYWGTATPAGNFT